jgi:hypothetical protein
MHILEGTWEEIRAHDSELAGRRVTVIVADESANLAERLNESKPGRFKKYLGVISNGEMQGRNAEQEVGRLIEVNYRREREPRDTSGC